MVIELLALAGKGVVGLMVVGAFITLLCALWHLQNYVRRRYPKVDRWGGLITATVVGIACLFVLLLVMGLIVETFFWR